MAGQILETPIHGESADGVYTTLSPPTPDGIAKDDIIADEKRDGPIEKTPRTYKRRWLMLGIFCMYSMSNAFQWIHLNIIFDVLTRFYNESLPENTYQQGVAIDWLSMIYMLAYIPLIFPTTYLLDKKGLRIVAICGTFLNCLGAWLKCTSAVPSRFGVLMFAQTICAIAQLFILGIPTRLAAVWFGPNEVSTATSLGVFGNQVGVAIGFVVPPLVVPNSDDINQIGHDLSIMFYSTAAITTALFLLVLVVFKESPPEPPSKAQYLAVQAAAHQDYLKSLRRLFQNRSFVILVITYGVNTGCYYAISTVLNTIFLYYFPGRQEDAGFIGLTIILAGVLGAIFAGIWLDKTKTFKGTTLAIYIFSVASMWVFTFTMDLKLVWVVYLTAGSLGFFMTGYLPVGFEFGVEVTFPEPEGTSCGLLNASAQLFGIIFTMGMRAVIVGYNVFGANVLVSIALSLGCMLTLLIKSNYLRQAAGEKSMNFMADGEIEISPMAVEC